MPTLLTVMTLRAGALSLVSRAPPHKQIAQPKQKTKSNQCCRHLTRCTRRDQCSTAADASPTTDHAEAICLRGSTPCGGDRDIPRSFGCISVDGDLSGDFTAANTTELIHCYSGAKAHARRSIQVLTRNGDCQLLPAFPLYRIQRLKLWTPARCKALLNTIHWVTMSHGLGLVVVRGPRSKAGQVKVEGTRAGHGLAGALVGI